MILIEETPVPVSALPIDGFREHLRLGSGFTDDTLQDSTLERFLRASLAAIEARTGKILIERDFNWVLSSWGGTMCQPLPVAPLSSILSVTIVDRDGVETSVNDADYTLVQDSLRPAIASTKGRLPAIPTSGSVRVQFTAGFGPAWEDLPPELSQAVLLLAAHYYEFRHEAAFSGSAMPYGVSALIEKHRILRLAGWGRQA